MYTNEHQRVSMKPYRHAVCMSPHAFPSGRLSRRTFGIGAYRFCVGFFFFADLIAKMSGIEPRQFRPPTHFPLQAADPPVPLSPPPARTDVPPRPRGPLRLELPLLTSHLVVLAWAVPSNRCLHVSFIMIYRSRHEQSHCALQVAEEITLRGCVVPFALHVIIHLPCGVRWE